ncbi:MAG: hypothetical protein Q9191_003924 [Dirinaria sp. TL-2023a]
MPTNFENAFSNTSNSTADLQLNQLSITEVRSASDQKAVVVGLYEVSGSGKTFLLNQLKDTLGQTYFAFYEDFEMIVTLVPGGLEAFQGMEEQEKTHWRRHAIDTIEKSCADSGHEAEWPVYTQNDLEIFTHILYLDIPAEVVAQRRMNDAERSRPSTSASHLYKWQQEEKTQLRDLCRRHSILFSLVSSNPSLLNKVSILLNDFRYHVENYNLSQVENKLNDAIFVSQGRLETVLFVNADRTLAAEDTGALF